MVLERDAQLVFHDPDIVFSACELIYPRLCGFKKLLPSVPVPNRGNRTTQKTGLPHLESRASQARHSLLFNHTRLCVSSRSQQDLIRLSRPIQSNDYEQSSIVTNSTQLHRLQLWETTTTKNSWSC